MEKMYNFSRLAIELNEPEDGVAPTDSRLRPDQRLMENGSASTVSHTLIPFTDACFVASCRVSMLFLFICCIYDS